MKFWARARRFTDRVFGGISDEEYARRELYKSTRGSQFTADDFRELKVHEELGWDPQKKFRGFFGRLSREGLTNEVGRVKSRFPDNMGRKIGLWEWTELAEKSFIKTITL